jgi:8-oxo-dGTP diphosphatase
MARREYPRSPIVAVGVIIRDDNRIAMIRRANEPFKGYWTFPGGVIDLGEEVRAAARREAIEETGLDVELEEVAAIVDNVVRDEEGLIRYHYVIIDFLAHPVGGTLRPGTDAQDARWVGAEDLDTLEVTEKAKKLARQLLAGLPRQ